MRNNPVKQHTVPKTYLKHFSHNGRNIFVYDKNKKTIEERNIKSVSIIKDFYTVTDTDTQEKMYDMENLLGQDIEPFYNPIIDLIEKKEILYDAHKKAFSFFIAAQLLRSPKIKRQVLEEIEVSFRNGIEGNIFDSKYLNIFKQTFSADDRKISYEEYLENKDNDDIKITIDISDDCYIQYLPHKISNLAEEIESKEWTFLLAPNKRSFITSDNPIFSPKDFSEIPIGRLEGDIFVLTKRLALMMGKNYGYIDVNLKEVKAINQCIHLNSDQFIFSHNKELLCKNIKNVNNKAIV